jgi:hypothetical protein
VCGWTYWIGTPDIYLHLRAYVPVSQAMALPLRGETGPRGAIVAGRIAPHSPFTDADLDMAETSAGQAAIALFALINSGSVSWLITGALRATLMITSSSGSSLQDSVCKASRQP